MVLHFASSPLVARSTSSSTKATPSSSSPSSSNNSGSTTAASSILQLSFFDLSKGKHHHHSSRPRNRQRTTSSSRLLHNFNSDKQSSSSSLITHWRWTVFKTMIRLAAFSSALFPILIVPTLRTKGLKDGFGRGTQYLTIVGLLVTMICIGLGIAGDVFNKPDLITLKNRILPMLVSVECVIAGLYWYLTLTNVYHIYPDGHKYLPFYIDIQMHGIPFFSGLVEMFFFSETLRIHRVKDICYYLLFAIFYSSWSSFCAHMDGEWPYPILQNQVHDWDRYTMMFNATVAGLAIHVIVCETHLRTRVQKALH